MGTVSRARMKRTPITVSRNYSRCDSAAMPGWVPCAIAILAVLAAVIGLSMVN